MATKLAARRAIPTLRTAAPARSYARRRPEESVLHAVVREQLETFLASARTRGHPVPRFIEQELRAYLACGVLAHGFLRLHCDACQLDRLVPFSCKRRGFCPSCGAVSCIQRFGSALNLNLHFHTLALDGFYAKGAGSPGELRALSSFGPPQTASAISI